jgi:hypothetical protein
MIASASVAAENLSEGRCEGKRLGAGTVTG